MHIPKSLISRLETPAYVYDRNVIEARCRELRTSFPGMLIFYAVKANSNPAILRIVRAMGLGVETVSPGEIRIAKNAGFPKNRISFTCSNLSADELIFAARNAGYVHLDSLTQIERWGRSKLGKHISLRINEGIGAGHHRHVVTGGPDSKFGISERDIPAARRLAKKYDLSITSLEQHIGSNILEKDRTVFLKSVRKLIATARTFPDVRHLDFGGGLGIPYMRGEKGLNLSSLGQEVGKLTNAFAKERGGMTFALEPGRYVVAESGTLLVSVTDMKSTSQHSFVGVNSGMNHLIRPAMYDSYHPIVNASRRSGAKKSVTIGGNICESSDIFARHRSIVAPQLGDVLAIGNAGAYGFSMASYYNLHELPKEVLLDGKRIRNISFDPRQFART